MKFYEKNCIRHSLRLISIAAVGFAAGLVGGLFGTGGGILIVFLFSKIYARSEKYTAKDHFAMTLLCMTLLSAVSLFSYFQNGSVEPSHFIPILLPAALGGIVGAFLLEKLPLAWLQRLFAALIVYAGATMLFKS